VAAFFVLINVFLFVFNLLPIPPLDGWKVLLGVVDVRTSYTLRQYEQYGVILLLVILLLGGRVIGPIGLGVYRFLIGS
jgi:Zn-dependent protease